MRPLAPLLRRAQRAPRPAGETHGVKRTAITSAVATVAVVVTLAALGVGAWAIIGALQKTKEAIDCPIHSAEPANVYGREAERTTMRLIDGSLPVKDPEIERLEVSRGTYQRWYADQISTTTDIGELIAARDGRTIRAALVVEPGATWRGWARGRHDRLVGFKALDARMPHLQTALADAYIDTVTWHDRQTNTMAAALGDPKKSDRYNIIADVALAATDDEFPNLIIRRIYHPDL